MSRTGEQWRAAVTVKVPGVRVQQTSYHRDELRQLLDAWIPGAVTGVDSRGGRVVRIVLTPDVTA